MCQLVDSFELVSRLQPREAFCSGRTNAMKFYHVVVDGKKIIYLYFTSLTPGRTKTVCTQSVISLSSTNPRDGHFLLLWSSEMRDSSTLRFVSSRLTPPQWGQTHVPPLQSLHGMRRKQTADKAKPSLSSHQVGRCLVGTWLTPELQEAINQGYIVQQVYKVWHFSRNSNDMFSLCRYVPQNQTGGQQMAQLGG